LGHPHVVAAPAGSAGPLEACTAHEGRLGIRAVVARVALAVRVTDGEGAVARSKIAFLAGLDPAVAAPWRRAVVVAAVVFVRVPVGALLGRRADAVAAAIRLAIVAAPVAVGGVAVVALLAGRDDAVAAAGELAVVVAAVAVGRVAIVALLAGGRRHDA